MFILVIDFIVHKNVLVPVNKGREWRPGTLSGSSSGPGSSHTKALSSSLASRPLEYFREGARPLGYFGEGARPDVMKWAKKSGPF